MARFKQPQGTWTARSTKLTNEAEARRLAFLWEGAGSTLAIETPAGAQIDRVVRNVYEQFTGKRMEPNPVRVFVKSWLERMKTTKKPRTAERYRKPAEDFVRYLGDRADCDIRSIGVGEVQGFIDREAKAQKSNATVSLNAKVLRAIFNTAIRAGAMERNPAGMLEFAEVVHEERSPFTVGELDALLVTAAGTDWETAILLGAFAGLRLGDACNLTWESVDFAEGKLVFMPQKTDRKKKTLQIPMNDRLRKRIDKLASTDEAQKTKFLCPTLAGREIGGRAGLSAAFIVEVMGKAAIATDNTERQGQGHSVARKSFHSLRHFFVSGMANAGVASDVRRKLAGHADEKQTARYSHLEMNTLRKAVATLSPKPKKARKTKKTKGKK
ncbi:MAG: tyrosine-type recombinase/integrase [Opitutaceae bacterium]|nr:tyrosine-type recombinase/integrase [Opitutaceae bacterium]